MKNKKFIALMAIVLVALVAVTTYTISAWLTDTASTTETTFTLGEVKYTFAGETTAITPVVPGQPLLVSKFTLTNASTVSSELRVEISLVFSYPETGTQPDPLTLVDMTTGANWVQNTTDKMWYYQLGTAVVEDGVDKYKIPASAQVIDVITALSIKGSVVGNDYKGSTLKLKLTFEAKQSDYVTWEQLGTADFEIGI